MVGEVALGADNPVRLQSMTSTPTADVEASAAQALHIAEAGGEIVRLTAQGVREAQALAEIRQRLHATGCNVPLVADIHFNPKAAFAAAEVVEKVRINPGNFIDPGRVFKHIDYTSQEYQAELDRLDQALTPLLDLCRQHHTALRIGVNHGSLSDRIMSRYGNTPEGMVESALEFLRVCRGRDFDQVVISIKASNISVMIETVLLLCQALEKEHMSYPLHLGVTEAGDGEDGRVKSAIGVGSLLARGIGDTIRVSLCEDPECEIPVARELSDYIDTFKISHTSELVCEKTPTPGEGAKLVVGLDVSEQEVLDNSITITRKADIARHKDWLLSNPEKWVILNPSHPNRPAHFHVLAAELEAIGSKNPIILRSGDNTVKAAVDLGWPLMSGIGNAIWTGNDTSLALSILQATRLRISKTEFIACPSCGRTMFDIQSTLAQVKAATSHLPGLKIAVMGCIVNGPGEMADADYGYVGSCRGHINLYRGRECVQKNIPQEQGVSKLIELLKHDGCWKEPS